MRLTIAILISSLLFAFPALCFANKNELSSGQTVYVSIYSNIYKNVGLAGMLSVRNTDLHNSLTILSAKYYDNNGKELKEYAPKPITLEPLASLRFTVDGVAARLAQPAADALLRQHHRGEKAGALDGPAGVVHLRPGADELDRVVAGRSALVDAELAVLAAGIGEARLPIHYGQPHSGGPFLFQTKKEGATLVG